ncbi:hypothetical protein [Kribbella sp. NPDC051137]|uniref:hypothetical protein n=1 Tax=Kribbella sp. NPDC051137 TaxID=3155045 RepID=UPI002F8BB2A7
MGQFSRYVESGDPPPALRRGFLIVAPCVAVVNAIYTRQLDDTLIAVLVTAQFLLAGIAPKRHRAVVGALNRRPALFLAVFFPLGTGWLFVLLSRSLSRLTSLSVAVPVAILLAAVAGGFRYRRLRSALTEQA